ncbi:MAG: phosphatase PAP2 family protein [Acidobacteriota bacterium]|nr:phosphatase PAP2 family protein [Acidobacteriota bacterium]
MPHIDRSVLLFVNSLAGRWLALDHMASAVDGLHLLNGIPLLSILVYRWFSAVRCGEEDERNLLLRDFSAVVIAGPLSRTLQFLLNFHPRPLHDPSLHIRISPIVDPNELNGWGSFPSDHASLYFAMAIVIALHCRRGIAIAASLFATIVLVPRVYFGYHWPSDILGGLVVAAGAVLLCRHTIPKRSADRISALEKTSPGLFYTAGFILCIQIATLFEEFRQLGAGIIKIARSAVRVY